MDKEKESSLIELVLQSFQTQQDLIKFLQVFPNGPSIIMNVAPAHTMRFFVVTIVDELRRRGLITTDFFERLSEERPTAITQIKDVQSKWIADLSKWEEPPQNEEKIPSHIDAPSLFISYSRRDGYFFEELTTHLKLLQRKRVIDTWHEGRVGAGEDWNRIIRTQVEQANIIILLISSDFLSSDYIWKHEFSEAFERHKRKEVSILPIIIRPCNWQVSPIANLQVFPLNAMPVSSSPNIDRVWVDIEKTVAQAANNWRDKK
jgi:hypothetical protein